MIYNNFLKIKNILNKRNKLFNLKQIYVLKLRNQIQ